MVIIGLKVWPVVVVVVVLLNKKYGKETKEKDDLICGIGVCLFFHFE